MTNVAEELWLGLKIEEPRMSRVALLIIVLWLRLRH